MDLSAASDTIKFHLVKNISGLSAIRDVEEFSIYSTTTLYSIG